MRTSFLFGMFLVALSASNLAAQEKVVYGTAIKLSAVYYLPVLAAQEQGFFKKNGIEAEWVPTQSGPDLQRDITSGAIQIGSLTGATDIPAIAKGVPSVIIANLQSEDGFAVWVNTKSRFQVPLDLKGSKIGVSRLGGAEHAYGQLVARGLGIAPDVQFVSTGGVSESVALLTTGGIDGVVLSPHQMVDLQIQGRVKPLLTVNKYEAKPWLSYTIVAGTDFVAKKPDTVKRVVASILEANRFLMSPAGKPFAIAKMKEVHHYSDEAAAAIYEILDLSKDGKFEKKAIQNVVDFMVNYDLMKATDISSIDKLYTDKFVR